MNTFVLGTTLEHHVLRFPTVFDVNKLNAASRSMCDGSSKDGSLSQGLYVNSLTSGLNFIVYW